MATLRDIKRRITSVTSTQQITSAMKMISAAKYNRAQIVARSALPYAVELRRMITTLAGGMTSEDHPLFEVREGGKSVVILFTSDRGLCGGFNNILNRQLHQRILKEEIPEAELVVFGRKGNDFFRRRGVPITRVVMQLREAEKRALLDDVFGEVIDRFLAGEVGRVYLAYNHFVSPVRQDPVIRPLLPILPPEEGEEDGSRLDDREVLFEPSRQVILDKLLPRYLQNQGLLAHLHTEAGEHGARMVAMEGATKNAGEMIAKLTLQYNRARQAAITTELIEIISGAESLR